MQKRGQVTIFIIIAIIIVALIVLFFVLKTQTKLLDKENINPINENQKIEINQKIENCLESNLIDGTRLIGLQGGYVSLPETHIKTESTSIAYGYYLNSKTLPSKSEIESEISNYVTLTLPLCLNFEDFPDLNINARSPESITTIKENSVLINTFIPLTISKGNEIIILNGEYESEIQIPLGKIYKTVEEIIEKESQSTLIEIGYLSELNYDIRILTHNENTQIYSIKDDNSKIEDIPYTFNFGIRKR
tara:strand:- start:66 stop:809 length:744 start_codon:yes stop_codon:yes gene_type:complete